MKETVALAKHAVRLIAFLGKFMSNSRLASILGLFSDFTLTRVTEERYRKNS
jgi:hypothetical protein